MTLHTLRTPSSRRHQRPQQSRLNLAFSTLLFFTAAKPIAAADALPRSALIQDGFIHKLPTTCPASAENQPWLTFPWTHTPTCVDVVFADDEEGAAGLETSQTFCAYTNAHYNNDRGVSFVATPEVAASVTMETFGMSIGGMEGVVGAEMGMWEVRDAEEKGKGLFAKKDIGLIFAGENVVVQTPVLLVDKTLLEAKSTERTRGVLRSAVEQLPRKTREVVKELSGEKLEDIIKTNGIGIKWPWVDEVPELLSVVPEVARINHACRPNTRWRFNDYTLSFEMFALRDIKPGEEITRSYGFELRPHKRRIGSLKANFGFTCKCSLCSSSDEELMASSDRISEIKALKSVLPTDPKDAPRLLELLPKLIEQLEEEGLVAELPQYEEILAYTWSQFGYADRAKHWADRAEKHWSVVAGKESWERVRCIELGKDVKAHQTWNTWKGEPWVEKEDGEE